jgi:predicted metal-dependent phosphoesterase TrpH
MNIDFHVHTSERSACATAHETDQIKKAISAGLDTIAITDHHRLVPMKHLVELNQRYHPLKILMGIEITADGEDWLVFGLHDPNLESDRWSYPDLHTYVRSKGGTLVMAHPYRYHADISLDLRRYPPDALEGRSNNIRTENIERIQTLAERLHVPTLCNSDAHSTGALGRYYNILQPAVESEQEILAALKSGALRHSIQK